MNAGETPLLRIDDLKVRLFSRGSTVHAVNGVSLELGAGKALGIVGESGSGKTTMLLAAMGLLPKRGANVEAQRLEFDGENLIALSERKFRQIRGAKVGMIFQDPLSSLNPVLDIGEQISEVIRAHTTLGRKAALVNAAELLDRVGIADPSAVLKKYPHQLSGGMRQRVVIASAVALGPKLIVADEPTAALDPTIQAQVLRVLKNLSRESGSALVIVSHDFGVVAEMADRIMVMYAGKIVEEAGARDLLGRPFHPYTSALLSCLPTVSLRGKSLRVIEGAPPDLRSVPIACAFAPRCLRAQDHCWRRMPNLERRRDGDTRSVACHFPIDRSGWNGESTKVEA